MTHRQGRIPNTILKFHPYINTTNAYMTASSNANAIRLGWTPAEIAQWTAINTADTQIYPSWSNKRIRTSDMVQNLKTNIKNCINFNKANKLLDRIAASPAATLMDLETFDIHKGATQKTVATHHTGNIADIVVPHIVYLGGGRLRYECRPDQTNKRSHMPDGADHLEVRVKLGDPAPASADNTDAQWLIMSSRAIVEQDFTAANIGQHIFIFFRWIDSKHPQRNGAWTAMMTVMIP